MNGTIVFLKPRGAIVESLDSVAVGDRLEVYRTADGVEEIVGTGVVRKLMPQNKLKLNPESGITIPGLQVGDLVRLA
jgi:hypothetical protein